MLPALQKNAPGASSHSEDSSQHARRMEGPSWPQALASLPHSGQRRVTDGCSLPLSLVAVPYVTVQYIDTLVLFSISLVG